MTALLFSALLPIALMIALGYGLRRGGFLGEAFWPQAERLAYFVLLPALFAHSLATADLSGVAILPLVSVLIGSILVVASILVLANFALKIDGPAFTSVFQGGIRFNNYVGIPAAVGLLGTSGAALGAVANATIVPTVNVLCALAFAAYAARRPDFIGVVRSIALNPLILGCAGGLGLRASGMVLPAGLSGFLAVLGQAALPIGLLCVGAALDRNAFGSGLRPLAVASFAKFVLLPMTTTLACLAIGLEGPAALIAVLFHALPTATSSYVMARQLGGDAPLMAAIISSQTLLALFAVPLALVVLAPLVGGVPALSAG